MLSRLLIAIASFFLTIISQAAADQALTIHPKSVKLVGVDDRVQLVVSIDPGSGRLKDATTAAVYHVADPKVARVEKGGRIIPLHDGSTTILVSSSGKSASVPVTVEKATENLPINFPNQIVPIFTKLSCNSGGCHGKSSGQNGFRLSLLGFEPELDYATLVKEGRGRRFFPAAPDHSLFLMKGTGRVAHGGGRKLDPDSDEYRILRRWIAAGVPYGDPNEATVERISVFPEHRVLAQHENQQIAVYAHYSNGRVEDITRRAQFESNDPEIAVVDANGLIKTLSLSGEAAVMARFQGQVTVVRITVPLGKPTPPWKFEPQTIVDKYTAAKWRELGLVPSELCSDEVFIRRVSLDLTGTLPTPEQIRSFLADSSPKKRERLIDRLLETPEFAYYFANKWAEILKVKRRNLTARAFGTFSFHDWIRDAMAKDLPYDEFARSILGAIGDETTNPPTVWYKEVTTPEQFVDDFAQVFLGQRLACANCHHHPYERWSQDDYWGLAAFFGRVGVKNVLIPGVIPQNQNDNRRQVIYTKSSGTVTNKRTGKPAVLKALDAPPLTVSADGDPRHNLADWMTDPKNPFFARTVANRYWSHFFGRGIVDPLDDMRVTNPPSNPALLDALAEELIKERYSLKSLIRTICRSRTYQLSAIPNEFNKQDKQAYARYYPKRLSAEVLYDAVSQVTGTPGRFTGLPTDRFAPTRAIMLPDESFVSYFLDVFGRPQRLSACECERITEANLAQTLHLLNSEEVQQKIAAVGGRADQLAKDPRPDEAKVEEAFLWALGHKPSEKALRLALDHLAATPKDRKKAAYENIIWALLNNKEFQFNQ